MAEIFAIPVGLTAEMPAARRAASRRRKLAPDLGIFTPG